MDGDLAPLPAGTSAPAFTLPRTACEAFALQDARGRSLVLVFYPGDWEPVSGDQLCRYQAYAAEIDRLGAVLVGISVDSIWSHLAFAGARGLQFPLLSDFQPKGAVARAYRVYLEAAERNRRALIVIDGRGVIQWSRAYSIHLNPGVDGVLSALETIQAAE